ncbi:hypothetical protein L208DRAFT_1377862 [Tricholoma matsutake]|nr:hypothetical protein L208DRAFT_1377862 [Tricholoma matsutake 945]
MGDSAAVSGETSSTSFVKISGDKFILNDAVYTVVGYFHDRLRMELFMSDFRNSYWIGLTGLSSANMHAAFADIPKAGGTTVWTWGFNKVTSPNGNYYQSWAGNTGVTDNVVAAAKANGIHLVVALSDYGGMDVLLNSSNHDLFYTDASVQTAYKNYTVDWHMHHQLGFKVGLYQVNRPNHLVAIGDEGF